MIGYTDIHQHVLYGVDDGAKDFQTMDAMLKASAADHVRVLVATPHVTPGVRQVEGTAILERFREANERIAAMRLPLKLVLGAENLYTPMMMNAIHNQQIITLGESAYVLVEFTPAIAFEDVELAVSALDGNGYCPILAHVERYECLKKSPGKLEKLKEQHHALFQMNCQTVMKRCGGLKGRHNRRMLQYDLIDFIASDAHDLGARRTHLSQAHQVLDQLIGKTRADALMGRTL